MLTCNVLFCFFKDSFKYDNRCGTGVQSFKIVCSLQNPCSLGCERLLEAVGCAIPFSAPFWSRARMPLTVSHLRGTCRDRCTRNWRGLVSKPGCGRRPPCGSPLLLVGSPVVLVVFSFLLLRGGISFNFYLADAAIEPERVEFVLHSAVVLCPTCEFTIYTYPALLHDLWRF